MGADLNNQGSNSVSNYCPKCNASYNLAKKFCGKCGAPLVVDSPAPITQDASSGEAPHVTQPEAPLTVPKSGRSRLLVGIVMAVLIPVAGYFGYGYIKHGMHNADNISRERPPSNQAQESQSRKPLPNPSAERSVQALMGTSSSSSRMGKGETNVTEQKDEKAVVSAGSSSIRGERSSMITAAEIEIFLQQHLRATEKAQLDAVLENYADKVDYYSAGMVDKNFIKKDKEYFYKRWPKMTYKLVSDIETEGTVLEDEQIARFTYDFYVENGKKHAKGTARNTMRIKRMGNALRIIEEKQEVIKREAG